MSKINNKYSQRSYEIDCFKKDLDILYKDLGYYYFLYINYCVDKNGLLVEFGKLESLCRVIKQKHKLMKKCLEKIMSE